MTDILSQTLSDLPENSCSGLQNAALTFDGTDYKELIDEANSCLTEITSSITAAPSISYITLDYPSLYSGSSTFLTGIRTTPNSNEVYISGFSTATGYQDITFIYKGPILGGGSWHPFNYPSSPGVTVNGTYIYGPNYDNSNGNLQAVGNYNTVETGAKSLGFLYQGPLDGSGAWITLNPQSLINLAVSNVIMHSNMGGFAVGNFDCVGSPLGKAFIYDINHNLYIKLSFNPDVTTTTAYGILYNGGTNYTITGGVTLVKDHGYITDFNSSSNNVSNWRFYSYNNELLSSRYSHFDGITANNINDGYNLCGDWINGKESGAFFAICSKDNHLIGNPALWVNILYPGSTTTSANTVYENNLLGVYLDDAKISHGFIATITYDE